MNLTFALCLMTLVAFTSTVGRAADSTLRAVHLQCEARVDPLGIDVPQPRLSWKLTADGRGARQAAYQVLVATSGEQLARDVGDVWDSGKIQSDESIGIRYGGPPLAAAKAYVWKVRVWSDAAGTPSPWSSQATWSMGLLSEADWAAARWIGAPVQMDAGVVTTGYHSAEAASADATKWVQIDLGKSTPIDAVVLHPLAHVDPATKERVAGFGFPIRFTVCASDDADFRSQTVVADHSAADFRNPGHRAVTFESKGISARYVRVSASKLARRTADVAAPFGLALAELQVMSGGKNVAARMNVSSLDSVEGHGWAQAQLTDGKGLAPAPGEPTDDAKVLKRMPLFRRAIDIDKPIARAQAFICGLGQFELRLNGEVVGDDVIQPGWTDYRDTCLYVAYDITARLRQGENAIGVMLGNGMYHSPVTPGRYAKWTGSSGPPRLIAQVRIDYADGTTQTLVTDASWKMAEGPVTFSGPYGGEDHDARLELAGWDQPRFNDGAWRPAPVIDGPGGRLAGSSRSAPAIRVARTFDPVKVTNPRPGVWVYDLGQNCSQMPRITLSGPAGARVRLTPAELLREDGSVSQRSMGDPQYMTYTLGGRDVETWSPRFYYVGCRYVQVEGAVPADAPNPGGLPVVRRLEGRFVTSSAAVVGEFACSNELFNRTSALIAWAMRSNMVSVLTDCPHREKLGWLEQSHLVGPSLMSNFDGRTLFSKIVADMRDAQTPEGLVPDIAPEFTKFGGGFRDSPEWGSACILIPWQMYEWYGDVEVLRRQYDTMTRYVAYLGTRASDGILSHGLGDWYDLGPKPPGVSQLTPIALTATAFYYRDLKTLAQIARLLDKPADAQQWDSLAGKVCDAFNAKFYDPQKHTYATGSQTANAIPLVFGLAPEGDRSAIMDSLVADVRNRNNGLTAGDVGYRYLLRALADGGRSDVIFDMNSRSDRPGYGYILNTGATSLTEGWDGSSSQNHFMLGHIMEWFYSDLAGIRSDPSAVGFRKVIIRPTPVGDVTWARARYDSVRGPIESSWKIEAGRFHLDVTIPPGTTATVHIPTPNPAGVTEGERPAADADGVKVLPAEKGVALLQVTSGTYRFTADAPTSPTTRPAADLTKGASTMPPADGPFQPTLDSFANHYRYPDWFRNAKLGIWAHWGPQAVPMMGDWYARKMYEEGGPIYQWHVENYGHPSKVGFKEIIPQWKAERWEPEQLMALYKKAGARYFVSMGVHHDNFDLWDSKHNRWNAVQMGPKRNVVAEWKAAAQKHGLRFGVSEHLGASFTWWQVSRRADKKGPFAGVPYDGADPKLEDLYHWPAEPGDDQWYTTNQRWHRHWLDRMTDLIDQHQPDLLYTDGGIPFGETGRRLVAHLYNSSARRNNGNADAVYNCKQDSKGMWVQDVERGVMPGIRPHPWQTDTSIGDWYYNRNWKYRGTDWVIHTLVDVVSKNGNLLLNVVQRPDGTLDPEPQKILAEMADWMAINGEAIYDSRPWISYGEGAVQARGGHFKEDFAYTAKDIRFTTKGSDTLYAIALGWPTDGRLVVRSLAKGADVTGRVRDVTLLGHAGPLKWTQDETGLSVELPGTKPCDFAITLKITGDDLTSFKPVLAVPGTQAVFADPNGNYRLEADAAQLHGTGIQAEQKGGETNIGFWTDPAEHASWKVSFGGPASYRVLASVATPAAGVPIRVEVGGQKVETTLPDTGGWDTFVEAELGKVKVDGATEQTLSIRPSDASRWQAVNVRHVRLMKVDGE